MKTTVYLLVTFVLMSLNLYGENLRVEISELKNNITKYKIIDVRSNKKFLNGHIKGALNFPVTLSYEDKNVDGKIINPLKMQNIVRKLGLNIDDNIVIYDNTNFFDASRVFWTFEVYGFKNVKLLNSQYKRWQALNLPISKKTPNPKKSNYIAIVDNKRLATKFTTQIATRNPNQVIIDARGYDAYIGKKSSAKRYGHIPKAIHVAAVHNLDKNNNVSTLKNLDGLKELYKNIDKNKKIVTYCAVGRIASTNYFALRELGYNVSNYDASWKEWGNDFRLPVTNLSKDK